MFLSLGQYFTTQYRFFWWKHASSLFCFYWLKRGIQYLYSDITWNQYSLFLSKKISLFTTDSLMIPNPEFADGPSPKCALISIYTPKEANSTVEELDEFYLSLDEEQVSFFLSNGLSSIIVGDFNIRLGQDSDPSPVTGPNVLGITASRNCSYLFFFCHKYGYVEANSFFGHYNEQFTWSHTARLDISSQNFSLIRVCVSQQRPLSGCGRTPAKLQEQEAVF